MELMSSLLLCVLVALLPQTLGKSRDRRPPQLEVRFNNSLLIHQIKPHMLRKQLLLNINGPPLVNNVSELQSVFIDLACKRCHSCMERAMKAFKYHKHMINTRPSAEELQEDVLTNEIMYRTKRDIVPTDETMVSTADDKKTTKKTRNKKNKTNRAVVVTKYNIDGEVYALKVKETMNNEQNESKGASTCQVYSVKKSFPCDSAEGESLLTSAKRKANKRKAKKEQDKTSTTSTTQKTQTSVFRKREVDNSQVPENFMPSIEEMY
ncbi:hypothetical protein ABMA28_005792 [Loxostege sticticalis]|uniref:Uncharacterized protein n=1 Tax=Loxostege sticticalis TaxID=481309 RepID=A0ABD0SMW0_LOXSC